LKTMRSTIRDRQITNSFTTFLHGSLQSGMEIP